MNDKNDAEARSGLMYAGGAFIVWGLLPIFWKGLGQVPAMEILCHRVVWSAVFVTMLMAARSRWGELRAILASRQALVLLTLSSLIIGGNWFLYIWAVNNGHIVESSLGYYINPLVNALLGRLVFHDRLRPLQVAAIGLAALGVSCLVLGYGHFPWIAMTLAVSFSLYGLIRKVVRVEPVPALFFETAVLALPALAWLLVLAGHGQRAFGSSAGTTALLALTGVVTSVPLSWFAHGARRIRMTTLGVLQYIAPTIAFLLGVLVYGEPFTGPQMATFALIWAGIGLYTADGLMLARAHLRAVGAAGAAKG